MAPKSIDAWWALQYRHTLTLTQGARATDRPTNLNNRIKCSLSIFCVCTLYLLWWWYASVSNVRRCSFFLFFFFVFFDFVFHSRSRSRSRFCHFNSFESSGCCCCLCLVRWYDSAFTLAGSISATSRSFRRRSSLPCTVTFMFDWLSGGSVRGAYSIVPFNFYAFFTHLIDSIDTESHFSVRWVVSVSVRPCPCISPISQLTENNFSLNYAISFHVIRVQVYMDTILHAAIRIPLSITIFECLNNYNCNRFVLRFLFALSLSLTLSFPSRIEYSWWINSPTFIQLLSLPLPSVLRNEKRREKNAQNYGIRTRNRTND